MLRSSLLFTLALGWLALGQAEKSESNGSSGEETIVLDRLVSFPEYGKTDVILLRNLGAEAVDLRGWWLTDSNKDKMNPERSYLFGVKEECSAYRGLPPGGVMELKPLTKANPCGIPFGVSTRDEANLFNKKDNLVASVSWDWSLQGLVMRRMPDGSYKRLQENKNLHNVLEDFPDLYLFREALQALGLFDKLSVGNGNSTNLIPDFPFESTNDALPYQLPKSMQPSLDSSLWPVVYGAMSYDSVPDEGPYTVLAPSSSALKDFFATWGPAKGLSKEQIFALPQFKEVMKTHIIPGAWMTGKLFDGTILPSASGVDVITTKKGGRIALHTGCSDMPPPGEFTCKQQLQFGKCEREYIIGAGYCLSTCGACGCHMGGCPEVIQPDIYAKNGFVHILDKVVGPGAEANLPKINNQLVVTQDVGLPLAVSDSPETEPRAEEDYEILEIDQPNGPPSEPTDPAPPQLSGESGPSPGPVTFASSSPSLASSPDGLTTVTSSSPVTTTGRSSTLAAGGSTSVLSSSVTGQPDVPAVSEGDSPPTSNSTDKVESPLPRGGLVWSTKGPPPSKLAPSGTGSSTLVKTG